MADEYLLVAGGSPDKWPAGILQENKRLVGVDRGAFYLLEHGVTPAFAVGDFDSISADELKLLEEKVAKIHYSIPEKDDTDTELAMQDIFQENPEANVTLIGATGGRIDHFLSNLWLPFDERFAKHAAQIQIVDNQNTVRYFAPGTHIIQKEADKKYLAIVCLTPVKQLTIYDAKYQLTNHDVNRPLSFASNEFVDETVKFSFASGMIATIQSKDKASAE